MASSVVAGSPFKEIGYLYIKFECKCNGGSLGLGSHISNLRDPCAHRHKVPRRIVVLLIHCIGRCYLFVSRSEAVMCSELSQRVVSSYFKKWEVGVVLPLHPGGRWASSPNVGGGSCTTTPSRLEVGVLSLTTRQLETS